MSDTVTTDRWWDSVSQQWSYSDYWQPISTAPKDGSKFLVWSRGNGRFEMSIAWFDKRDPEVWQVQHLPLLGVRRDHLTPWKEFEISWMPFPQSETNT